MFVEISYAFFRFVLCVLRLAALDQLLTVGLLRCRSAAGRRCLHALVLSLRNCALQATHRLQSAPTQPSAANATAAAAAVLGSEAYGGSYFAPASPAAEEELLLLQCLDLLSSSLLGPAGMHCSIHFMGITGACMRNNAAASARAAARISALQKPSTVYALGFRLTLVTVTAFVSGYHKNAFSLSPAVEEQGCVTGAVVAFKWIACFCLCFVLGHVFSDACVASTVQCCVAVRCAEHVFARGLQPRL